MNKSTILTALIILMAVFTTQSQTAIAPASGDGSTGDPYQIATLDNLYWVTQNSAEWDKDYIQTADINAITTNTWDAGAGFLPIGNNSTNFTGSYNGQGHIIDGLFINRPSDNMVGLFGRSNSSTIDSLGLINVDVTGYGYIGGLVGRNNSSTVSNSYSTGTVLGTDYYIGGLVGDNSNSSAITNSYSTASVSGYWDVGGLVGYIDNSTITNSYSIGFVSTYDNTGGLLGNNNGSSGTITNSFWNTETSGQATSAGGTGLTTAEMHDQANYTAWDFTNTWKFENCISDYPVLSWQKLSAPLGTGTIPDPYQIATLCDLKWLSETDTVWDYQFIQTADIDASETSTWDNGAGFSPIGNATNKFTGLYKGEGYIIDSLFIDRPNTNFVSLFGYADQGLIVRLGVINVNITGKSGVGGIVGVNNNSSGIERSYSTGNVVGTNNSVGGIVGSNENNSVIANSYSRCNITVSNSGGGGLAGVNYNNSGILKSYSAGSVSGGTNLGGLIGDTINNGLIISSFWDTETSGQTTSAIGIGKTTAEMQTLCIYIDGTEASWDFMLETTNGGVDDWGLNASENGGYPFLSWQGFTHTESCCGYIDLESPILTTQNTTVYLDTNGNATLIADSVITNTSDNCAISDTTLSQTIFDCSDVLTPVNIDVTLTDITGNFITEQVTITVADTINPTITCIANQLVTLTFGQTEYTVVGTEFDPTASDDNCNVASIENDFNSTATLDAATLPIGITTITWTVTDDNGNTIDCSLDVQVDAYVGINTISENGIEIYPNPATNKLTISNVQLTIKKIEVLDITGKVVKQLTIKQSNILTIEIKDLKQGVYFIKLTTINSANVLRFVKE